MTNTFKTALALLTSLYILTGCDSSTTEEITLPLLTFP